MESISYTAARSSLARIMDEVCDNHMPVVITRQKAKPVVLLSLADYHALEETAYLLGNPANAARLAQSVADIEFGKTTQRKLIE